jgi:hypothetical protein
VDFRTPSPWTLTVARLRRSTKLVGIALARFCRIVRSHQFCLRLVCKGVHLELFESSPNCLFKVQWKRQSIQECAKCLPSHPTSARSLLAIVDGSQAHAGCLFWGHHYLVRFLSFRFIFVSGDRHRWRPSLTVTVTVTAER